MPNCHLRFCSLKIGLTVSLSSLFFPSETVMHSLGCKTFGILELKIGVGKNSEGSAAFGGSQSLHFLPKLGNFPDLRMPNVTLGMTFGILKNLEESETVSPGGFCKSL